MLLVALCIHQCAAHTPQADRTRRKCLTMGSAPSATTLHTKTGSRCRSTLQSQYKLHAGPPTCTCTCMHPTALTGCSVASGSGSGSGSGVYADGVRVVMTSSHQARLFDKRDGEDLPPKHLRRRSSRRADCCVDRVSPQCGEKPARPQHALPLGKTCGAMRWRAPL